RSPRRLRVLTRAALPAEARERSGSPLAEWLYDLPSLLLRSREGLRAGDGRHEPLAVRGLSMSDAWAVRPTVDGTVASARAFALEGAGEALHVALDGNARPIARVRAATATCADARGRVLAADLAGRRLLVDLRL